jgi:phosphoribosylamine--glycine ligase
MRFLGIGECADLADLYLRLVADGHEVKIFIGYPLCRDTLAGLIQRVDDWQAELDWIRAVGPDGCILFENIGLGYGEIQDRLRRDGFHVIGGGACGAALENDRAYAQGVLADLGLATAPTFEFSDVDEARRFIDRRPARYVLKSNAPTRQALSDVTKQGADVPSRALPPAERSTPRASS